MSASLLLFDDDMQWRLLLSTLFPYTTLFRSADVSRSTVQRTLSAYLEGGLKRSGQARSQESHSELDEQRASLEERSEEHTSELQSLTNLVCRLPLEKKKNN